MPKADEKKRSEKTIVYLEPVIHTAMTRYVDTTSDTYSEYMRKLAIKDLRARGLLTEQMLEAIL